MLSLSPEVADQITSPFGVTICTLAEPALNRPPTFAVPFMRHTALFTSTVTLSFTFWLMISVTMNCPKFSSMGSTKSVLLEQGDKSPLPFVQALAEEMAIPTNSIEAHFFILASPFGRNRSAPTMGVHGTPLFTRDLLNRNQLLHQTRVVFLFQAVDLFVVFVHFVGVIHGAELWAAHGAEGCRL